MFYFNKSQVPTQPRLPIQRIMHKENSADLLRKAVNTYEYTKNQENHFIRHPISETDNSVYVIFGMSREEAASLMKRRIDEIKAIISPAVNEALGTDGFINYLVFHEIVTKEVPSKHRTKNSNDESSDSSIEDLVEKESVIREHLKDEVLLERLIKPICAPLSKPVEGVHHQRILTDAEREHLLKLDSVSHAYILYDVSMGKVNNGLSPICMLRALAKLEKKALNLWRPSEGLTSHELHPDHVEDDDDQNVVEEINLNILPDNKFELIRFESISTKKIISIPTISDQGFQAFGVKRSEVYNLFVKDLWVASRDGVKMPAENSMVKKFIRTIVRDALVRKEFYEYIISSEAPQELKDRISAKLVRDYTTSVSLSKELCEKLSKSKLVDRNVLDVLREHHDADGGAAEQAFFDALENDHDMIQSYCHYDLLLKRIENGWSHPLVLLAYATLSGIDLKMWKRNTWNKDEKESIYLAPVEINVDYSRVIMPDNHRIQYDARDMMPLHNWMYLNGEQTLREMNIFFSEGNKFERLELLSEDEYLSKEELKRVQQEKLADKREKSAKAVERLNYKMTPHADFDPLASEIIREKGNELKAFYENTALEAAEFNLWNVLRYLVKESGPRKKFEIMTLKDIQGLENTSRSLADEVGGIERVKALLEYLVVLSEHKGGSLSFDAETVSTLQSALDKMLVEYKAKLISEFVGFQSDKKHQLFVTDDLELIVKTPEQKTAEYKAIVDRYVLPYSAEQLLSFDGGFDQCIKILSDRLNACNRKQMIVQRSLEDIGDLLHQREPILGSCINDRTDIGTFLEGKEEFSNKYKNEIISIIGDAHIERFRKLRKSAALDDGDFLFEFFGKYPPSVSADTVYSYQGSHGNNLLHKAVEKMHLSLVRGLLMLGVNPAKKNSAGTRPVDLAVQLFDEKLGDLMNRRIELDNKLLNEEADQKWMEDEIALIKDFHAYVGEVEAARPDKEDPGKANADKNKLTVYSQGSDSDKTLMSWLFDVRRECGLFYFDVFNDLKTFDQKIEYIFSHYRQLVSIDKISFIEPFKRAQTYHAKLKLAMESREVRPNDEKTLATLKRRMIELFRLRKIFFEALLEFKHGQAMSHAKLACAIDKGSRKFESSELSDSETTELENARAEFNNHASKVMNVYDNFERLYLARHSTKNDLALVEYIEKVMTATEAQSVKNYHNIYVGLTKVATLFRDRRRDFGIMPDQNALDTVRGKQLVLLREHDEILMRLTPGQVDVLQSDQAVADDQIGDSNTAPINRIVALTFYAGGFNIRRGALDNNTLFNSIEYLLGKIGYAKLYTAQELRVLAVEKMKENISLHREYISLAKETAGSSIVFDDYLNDISEAKLPGGAAEVLALARALNIGIEVRCNGDEPVLYGDPASTLIYLSSDDSLHYHALVPRQSKVRQIELEPTSRSRSTSASTQNGYFPGQSAPNNGQPESSAQGGYKRSY